MPTAAEGLLRSGLARRLRRTESLRAALAVVRQTPDIFASVQAMQGRKKDLLTNTLVAEGDSSRAFAALLAGIAANRRGRALLELAIDRAARSDSENFKRRAPLYFNEVIIGAGLHGAVYAASRQQFGGDGGLPLVIDRRKRSGGIFALAQRPVFFLNSRNRPENAFQEARPGSEGSLNSVRCAPLQASDFSSEEYPSQDEQALVTRIVLALYARLMLGVEVVGIAPSGRKGNGRYCIFLKDVENGREYQVYTNRIIIATGVGEPKKTVKGRRNSRVMDFDQFVERMGNTNDPFPLKDFKRVAVVGAKDSGRVVVEYLLGQGPQSGMSGAGLDFPRIDWYGQENSTKRRFEECERSRYKGIGRYLPRGDDTYYRVQPRGSRVIEIQARKDGVTIISQSPGGIVRKRNYGHVILATGYQNQVDKLLKRFPKRRNLLMSGNFVYARAVEGNQIYIVGPAAEIPLESREISASPVLRSLPDNSVAIFRYVPRTAQLALQLSSVDASARNVLAQPDKIGVRALANVSAMRPAQSDPGSLLQTATMTMPASAPEPLPDGLVTEDVVKALAHEALGRSRAKDNTVVIIRIRRNDDTYRCEMSASRPIMTREQLERMMDDPTMKTLLERYTNGRNRRVEMTIPFRRGRVDLPRVQMI